MPTQITVAIHGPLRLKVWPSTEAFNQSSGGRSFGFGFIINNANGFIENVIRKIVDCFPNGFVNRGGARSFCSLFTEEPKQAISEILVSPRDLQRQVRNPLKGVSVRARGPFNVLVHQRLFFRHFKKTTVFCFLLSLSSPHLDQVSHLAAHFLCVAFILFRGQIVLLVLSYYRSPFLILLEPSLLHSASQTSGATIRAMAPAT